MPPLSMSSWSSERGRRLMIQPMVNKELELVVEDVMNRLQELSHIVLNIAEGVAPSPSLVSLAEIDSISMTISETRLVLNQPSLLDQG
jgi:hypothetical protein